MAGVKVGGKEDTAMIHEYRERLWNAVTPNLLVVRELVEQYEQAQQRIANLEAELRGASDEIEHQVKAGKQAEAELTTVKAELEGANVCWKAAQDERDRLRERVVELEAKHGS